MQYPEIKWNIVAIGVLPLLNSEGATKPAALGSLPLTFDYAQRT
jgi:hypothetical protein